MKVKLGTDGLRMVVDVSLSERNLRALRHKVTMPGSHRRLESTQPDGTLLVVRVESDDEHYAGRHAPPGVMHPGTEAFLRAPFDDDDDAVDPHGEGRADRPR